MVESDAVEVSEEELEIILDCVYTNTAMEDDHVPKWAVEKWQALKRRREADGR